MATPASSSLRLTQTRDDVTSTSGNQEFVQFTATMRLPVPPVFSTSSSDLATGAGDGGIDGVREVLAGWVMRYLPPLRAVVLSFDPNPTFLHPSALFDATACPFEPNQPPPTFSANDDDEQDKSRFEAGQVVRLKTLPMIEGSGFTLADVEWKGLGWAPRVGMKLVGTPTLSTSSHVSLLLHNLFNASIPSSHIPRDRYEFDPACPVPSVVLERRQQNPKPSKSIQELELAAKRAKREALGIEGDEAEDGDSDDEEEEDAAEENDDVEEEFEEQGWWVDKQTRQPLGGQQGRIEFTLVSLSTSNSLLSCTGSLLSDPFSPTALSSLSDPSSSSSETALLEAQTIRSGHSQTQPRLSDDDDDSNNSSDSEDDSQVSGDDDDGVGTGIPLHQGAPSKTEDPTRSDDSSEEEEEGSDSSRSPSPEPVPVPEKKGKKTKAEKKGKPPAVLVDETKKKKKKVVVVVGEEEATKKKRKVAEDETVERKSKKSRKA